MQMFQELKTTTHMLGGARSGLAIPTTGPVSGVNMACFSPNISLTNNKDVYYTVSGSYSLPDAGSYLNMSPFLISTSNASSLPNLIDSYWSGIGSIINNTIPVDVIVTPDATKISGTSYTHVSFNSRYPVSTVDTLVLMIPVPAGSTNIQVALGASLVQFGLYPDKYAKFGIDSTVYAAALSAGFEITWPTSAPALSMSFPTTTTLAVKNESGTSLSMAVKNDSSSSNLSVKVADTVSVKTNSADSVNIKTKQNDTVVIGLPKQENPIWTSEYNNAVIPSLSNPSEL